MDDEQTFESEKLYMRGMAQLRAAQWKAAVETLSELRSISSAYPEVDTLIADALLKVNGRLSFSYRPLEQDVATALTQERLLAALKRAGGNRTLAARMLSMGRATLYRRMAALNIPPEP